MIFRFRRFPLNQVDPVNPDRNYHVRPVIPLLVMGPSGKILRRLIVDSGAVSTVLPIEDAARIGIRRFIAEGNLFGVGSSRTSPHKIHYGEVELRIWEGSEVCHWKAVIGFTSAAMSSEGLFGISGGLEYFHTALDVFANQITLIPRVTLPVVQDTH